MAQPLTPTHPPSMPRPLPPSPRTCPPPQRNARVLVWRDAAVSAAMMALLACAPNAHTAGAVSPLTLKLLRALGAVLPPAAAAASMTHYARHRSSVVLASHVLLLLGGLPSVLLPTAAATTVGVDPAWLSVAAAAVLITVQPTRLAHSVYLVLWQALPPLLRLLGTRAAPVARLQGCMQLGASALAVAIAYTAEVADRWVGEGSATL